MKKIVSAVTAAGLLAGAAFADVSFSYTGKNYFNASSDSLRHVASERSDCLGVTMASSDGSYGVRLDLDLSGKDAIPQLDEYYGWMTFSKISTQVTAGVWNSRYVDRVVTDKRGIDFDAEDFELYKPGIIAPLNEDALSIPGAYSEKLSDDGKKVASRSSYRQHNVGIDSDNLTMGNLAMLAAFTPAGLPGKLMIKVGLVDVTGKARSASGTNVAPFTSAWSSTNSRTDDNTKDENSAINILGGFVGEVAYRQDGLFNVNLAVRSFYNHTASAALFFSPLMIENLQATAGVTLGFNGAGYLNKSDADGEFKGARKVRGYNDMLLENDIIHKNEGTVGVEWAADLRLRYAFSDRLSFTTMHNFSSYLSTLQIEEAHIAPNGPNGGDYWQTGTAGYQDETKWSKNDYAMWNMVNLTWNLDDKLVAGFTLQHRNRDMDSKYTENNDLWFSPNLTIAPTEKFSFTVVTRMHWQNFGADETKYICECPAGDHKCGATGNTTVDKFEVKIPVIFTFNY